MISKPVVFRAHLLNRPSCSPLSPPQDPLLFFFLVSVLRKEKASTYFCCVRQTALPLACVSWRSFLITHPVAGSSSTAWVYLVPWQDICVDATVSNWSHFLSQFLRSGVLEVGLLGQRANALVVLLDAGKFSSKGLWHSAFPPQCLSPCFPRLCRESMMVSFWMFTSPNNNGHIWLKQMEYIKNWIHNDSFRKPKVTEQEILLVTLGVTRALTLTLKMDN